MTGGFLELTVIVLLAAVLGFAARLFKQPIVLAYLATGLIVGYFGLLNVQADQQLKFLADLGIMFLLFLVGLEINYSSLKIVGKPALIVGISQILVTAALAYGLAVVLGFEPLAAAYIAMALTFSSTVIIVKLLSEKRDLNSLYGKITVGVLLLQDFVAVLLLVILSGIEGGGKIEALPVIMTILKGLGLFALMLWLGRKILPHAFHQIARTPELIFLISLAWVFLVAALVNRVGFSIEIAGFLAGLALANSSEHFQITARIKPLRDFFIMIFFVILGSSVILSDLGSLWLPILVFSLFVTILEPLIVTMVMSFLRYRKRTSFLTGLTMGQVSEFSLVLVALGMKVGHVTSEVVTIVTAVGMITILVSSYSIIHGHAISKKLANLLSHFERKKLRREPHFEDVYHKPIILIGAHRTGQNLAYSLPKEDLLIIDFDPEIAMHLSERGYDCIFGDVMDPDVIEKANFAEAKLVISTSPDSEDNLALLEYLNEAGQRPKVIVRAETEEDAQLLYKNGADYVLLPHFTSGQYLGKTISVDPEANILDHLRERDLEVMLRNGKLYH